MARKARNLEMKRYGDAAKSNRASERFWRYVKQRTSKSSDVLKKMNIRIDKTRKGGRKINEINCNLRCVFCHGDFFIKKNSEIAVENQFFVNSLKRLHEISQKGMQVHISGMGEPTLCGGELVELVQLLNELPFVEKVKLTSNGIKLGKMANELSEAGLSSVNISLHSLNRKAYERITRVDALGRVLDSLDMCIGAGLPTKLNTSIGPAFESELEAYLALSSTKGIPIKLLQIISADEEEDIKSEALFNRIKCLLGERADFVGEYSLPYLGKVMYVEGAIVDIADIKNSRVELCKDIACRKKEECLKGARYPIRLNSDGYLQSCPVRFDNVLDLKKSEVTDGDIVRALASGGKYALIKRGEE